jgi:hypothetical protein
MSKNRSKTGLVHKKGKETFDVSKEKATGKYFIKGTDIEVPENKLMRKKNLGAHKRNYDFSKPSQAQDLGDEWSDYAWSADDY